jgi:TetR/AcrR family transcriptional regulator, transcriptional repressor for nem operon
MSATKTSGKENTRSVLIERGIDLMLEKGYNNTGLNDVLKSCGVPKGSFYYYFQSKEDFGLQIINTFDETYVAQLDSVLGDLSLRPVDRIRRYVDSSIEKAQGRRCSRGCLIANLSQEMADQNELFRVRLAEIIRKRRDRFAQIIEEARVQGDLPAETDSVQAAEFFLCAWEGAIMRAKVQKDVQSLLTCKQMIFEKLFQIRV